jgi:hypothetical protein
MENKNFTVVRNESYTTSQVTLCEGHNERRNKNPLNADIVPERAGLNVHYHQNFTPDGAVESYQQTIDRLLAEKKIVKHNFKPKSAIIDELVFDVNSGYFDERGGYEFAVKFYEEAYRCAVKEVGGEQYILSAVLHADERNSDLSDKFGRDVYHYHLHVIYVPVVEGKEIKYTARAGKELQGKVKAVITQINHTDKWPCKKVVKGYINEYSKLQTRYFEHMRAAGFEGFERGVEGSTAEHLKVLQFKIQQEQKRLDALVQQAAKTEAKLSKTERTLEKKTAQVEKLNKETAVKTKVAATIKEIDAMGHTLPFVPGVHNTDDEETKLKTLAKKSLTLEATVAATKKKMAAVEEQLAAVEIKLRDSQAEARHWHNELTDLKNEVKDYLRFVKNFPAQVEDFFDGLRREEQEQARQIEQERQAQQAERQQQRKKSFDKGAR